MAMKGKKDNDNKEIENIDIDSMIMSAIEETDKEQAEAKENARKAHEEMLEANRIKAEKEAALKEKIAKMANNGRRYFLLAEETIAENDILKIKGTVHGEVHKGDELYIYRPGGAVLTATLDSIITPEDKMVDVAKGAKVEFVVPFDFKKAGFEPENIVPKFSVVSGIRPQITVDNNKLLENPALLGLSLEYKNFKDDKNYTGILVAALANSKFLLPVNSSVEELDGVDGKRKIGFIMIGSKEQEKKALPIFADWGAMSAWKDLFNGEKKPTVVTISFMDLVKLTAKEGVDFVLDPFGPVSIGLPRQLIDRVAEAKAKATSKTRVTRNTIGAKEAAKVLVVEPMPGEETNQIRKALREFAGHTPSISSLGLLMKRQNGKISYFTIVDCPREATHDVFTGLYAAAKPYMNAVTTMDFSRYEDAPFADDYFSTHTLDYVRLGNY